MPGTRAFRVSQSRHSQDAPTRSSALCSGCPFPAPVLASLVVPTELIKCPNCGSSGATEFKPESFVCRHCEAVFRFVEPGGGGPLGCRVGSCGVIALARCTLCHRPFCLTHQGRGSTGVPYSETCSGCTTARLATAKEFLVKARPAMAAAGIRTVSLRGRDRRSFMWRPVGEAWVLGKFAWQLTSRDTDPQRLVSTAMLVNEPDAAPEGWHEPTWRAGLRHFMVSETDEPPFGTPKWYDITRPFCHPTEDAWTAMQEAVQKWLERQGTN
jgi:hypothetical protein